MCGKDWFHEQQQQNRGHFTGRHVRQKFKKEVEGTPGVDQALFLFLKCVRNTPGVILTETSSPR